jgi:hypothetical protein
LIFLLYKYNISYVFLLSCKRVNSSKLNKNVNIVIV